MSANLWPFVLVSFLLSVVTGIANGIDPTVTLVVFGPGTAAAYVLALSAVRTGRVNFDSLSDMGPVWLQALVAGILISVFTMVGMVFLIVPGLVVAAMYMFAQLLIVDRRMNFWEAMEASRRLVSRDVVGFVGFLLAIIGVNLLGLVCLGVGVWVSGPVTLCAVATAYEELWPHEASGEGTAEPTS